MTKAEWFREKHPDPDEDKKYVEVADEAYDAGYEACSQIKKNPVKKSKEAVENTLKIYSMILNPCPECRRKNKLTENEKKICKECCFNYTSKFEM